MTDYEQVNRRTRKVVRTLKDVREVRPIPSGYKRLFFRLGSSCKVNTTTYDLRQTAEKR